MRRLFLLLLTAMILNVSCDNLTKSKSDDTEESDSKAKKKKKKAADEDEDVAADDENTDDRNADDEETSNDDSRSRNNDDEEESDGGGWSRAEQKQFMESCVENTGFSQSKAESYCDCMLNKLQRKYPKAASMENVSGLEEKIKAMAPGCLE